MNKLYDFIAYMFVGAVFLLDDIIDWVRTRNSLPQ